MVTTYKNAALVNKNVTRAMKPTEVRTHNAGIAFKVDNWTKLDRFLILGTEGGTYYVEEKELTKENYTNLKACIAEDGVRVVETIVAISEGGRAPKQNPAIFALAAASVFGNEVTRAHAYRNYTRVCRIPTHEALFATYRDAMSEYIGGSRVRGGMGSGYKRAIGRSFNEKDAKTLAYHAVKYPSRYGWAQADLLRLSRPTPVDREHSALFKYIVDNEIVEGLNEDTRAYLNAVERVKNATEVHEVVSLVLDYNLPREVIPTQFLNEVDVWAALLSSMPMTAMIRNLNKMTQVGLLTNSSNASRTVANTLLDQNRLLKARVHPMAVLAALKVYGAGHGVKGSLTWNPVGKIMNALDEAFYLAFETVEPTNKNILLALDVSGSMASSVLGMPFMSCREASAAMAMVIARTEPNHMFVAYSDKLVSANITATMRMDEVIRKIEAIPMGGTFCSLPMQWAIKNNARVDAFISITDNETTDGVRSGGYWSFGYGSREAPGDPGTTDDWLKTYRQKLGIPARSIVMGMAANDFSIASPSDPLALDIVGLDSSVPDVISNFIRE